MTLDNYYNSPELAETLLQLQTDCYYTHRKKEDLPRDFWNWKPLKGDPPQKQFQGDITVLRWNNITKTKSIKYDSMLTTIHTGMLIDSGKKNRITGEEVRKPDVIVNYNSTIGSVDTLSRVIIPYPCQ